MSFVNADWNRDDVRSVKKFVEHRVGTHHLPANIEAIKRLLYIRGTELRRVDMVSAWKRELAGFRRCVIAPQAFSLVRTEPVALPVLRVIS